MRVLHLPPITFHPPPPTPFSHKPGFGQLEAVLFCINQLEFYIDQSEIGKFTPLWSSPTHFDPLSQSER